MPNFIRDVEEIRERAIRNIEEGAVTAAYELEPEKVVNILNEALATEIVCVLRYMHHYFMATGVHAKAVSAEFKEHADAEREHADEIAERIQQLGGKPDFNPRTLMQRSAAQYVEGETLGDMIREDLIAERIVIDVYNQMIRFIGDKDPTTRVLLEHILGEEEEHASDLSDLLFIVEPSSGDTEGVDPGVHPLRMHGKGTAGDSSDDAAEERYDKDVHGGDRGQRGGRKPEVAAEVVAGSQRGQSGRQPNRGNQDEGAMATRGGMGGHTAKGTGERNANSANQAGGNAQRGQGNQARGNVGQIQRDAREPRPMAQTIADRERTNDRRNNRGQQQNQRSGGGRNQGTANRQATEQFAGRGSVNIARAATPTGRAAENAGRAQANNTRGEMRPSRATNAGRPDTRNAKPEHEPGTTGRPRRNNVDANSIGAVEEGGMGGGTRAVRVTNKQRKNRAA
jgi:bacterioferritin